MAKTIAAIVGCGPCLKDLEDPEWLYENRYVVSLNDAVNRVPSHACTLVTFEAIVQWWRDVGPDRVAICSQWHLGRISRFMRRPITPPMPRAANPGKAIGHASPPINVASHQSS